MKYHRKTEQVTLSVLFIVGLIVGAFIDSAHAQTVAYQDALAEDRAAKEAFLKERLSGAKSLLDELNSVFIIFPQRDAEANPACPSAVTRSNRVTEYGAFSLQRDDGDYELHLFVAPGNHFEDAERAVMGEITRPTERMQILLFEKIDSNQIIRGNIYVEVYKGAGIDANGNQACDLLDRFTVSVELCAPFFGFMGAPIEVCNMSNGQFLIAKVFNKLKGFVADNLEEIQIPIRRTDLPDFSSVFTVGAQ